MQPSRVKTEDPISAALRLQQEQASRASDIAQKTARVCLKQPTPSAISGLAELSGAALQRSVALQVSWVNDWMRWSEFAASIQGADTTAKYLDRLTNIYMQAEAQMASQVTEASELADNIGISYAYWLNQQLDD